MTKIESIAATLVAASITTLGAIAPVTAVSITNGGFNPGNAAMNGKSVWLGGAGSDSISIPGWTVTPATNHTNPATSFVFLVPDGQQVHNNLASYNPANVPFGGGGGAGGLRGTANVNSPDGSGWFIVADGEFDRAYISQNLTGLIPNQQYEVSFYQAAGQQKGFFQHTTEWWSVSLGSQTLLSTVISPPETTMTNNDPNTVFATDVSPWQQQTLTFTANNANETLSFLSQGTPVGMPPFVLLSGVSIKQKNTVPEPLEYVGTLLGGGACVLLRKKLKTQNR